MFLVIVHCLHYILDETNRQGFKQTQQSRLAPRSFVVKRRKIDYRLRKIVSVISLVPRMGRPAFERSAAGRRRTAYRRIDGVTATGAKTRASALGISEESKDVGSEIRDFAKKYCRNQKSRTTTDCDS